MSTRWRRPSSSKASQLGVGLVAIPPAALAPAAVRAASRGTADTTAAAPAAPAVCSGPALATNSEATDNTFRGIRSVIVRSARGDVRVTPSADATTNVHTTARWGFSNKPTLVQHVQGDVLTITTKCPSADLLAGPPDSPCRRDISITAPADVALDVAASVGDVTADGMAGTMSLSSGVGDVSATSVHSHQINLATGVGNAMIDAATAPQDATATSGTGNIEVRLPAGTYAIDAATARGRVTIAGIQQNSVSPNCVVAHGSVGDVRITAR